jgi:hemerythrin-like domain-containing protein
MRPATTIIRDEHRTISAVLQGLKELARDALRGRGAPPFPALRAMVRFIDEFPEKLHHPKEETLLERLLAKAPEAEGLVEALRREHSRGGELIRGLERALLFYEDRTADGSREFFDAVNAYADFHWQHMRREEQELLPLAERTLGPEDWRAINASFAENPDFDKAFSRIVRLAPAPVGVGPA